MTDFVNRTPNPGKIIDDNDDVIDLQQLAESGQITVTATMAPVAVVPIGTSVVPKYVNMTPIAGKFINASDEVIDLVNFLTSGDIVVQVSGGGGGGAPTTSTYITQTDETVDLPNSIPAINFATGIMTSTNGVGIATSKTLTGTVNQIDVANGDGSANPTYSLSSTLEFPGTTKLGGDLDVVNYNITTSGPAVNISSIGSVIIGSPWLDVTAIRSAVDVANKIVFDVGIIQILPDNSLEFEVKSSGVKLASGATVNDILSNAFATPNDTSLMTSQAITTYANSVGVGSLDGSNNEIDVFGFAAPGDAPTYILNLSSTIITPGTLNVGGGGATITEISTDTTLSGGNSTASSTGAIKTYIDERSLNVNSFSGTSTTMIANTRYIVDNVSLVTLTLPAVMSVGDVIEVWGNGLGLFRIAQQAGQQVHVGVVSTTVGATGYVESTQQYDFVRMCCFTADTVWSLIQRGTLDVI